MEWTGTDIGASGVDATLRVLLDQLPAVVWTMDRDLALTSVMGNRSALLLQRRSEIVRDESCRKALAGESHSFAFEDGESVYDAWLEPLRGGGGAIVGVVGCAIDVSQQRRLEEQFHAAQRMESVGRLAGGIAHDFNNVLTIIECYTKFLLDELGPSSSVEKDILEIQEAARRAASLVSQLLAFSRRQVQELEVLDPNTVIDSVERMLSRVLGEDIELRTNCDRSLRLVRADRAQLEQVLLNLAVNARDAMPDGGHLTIESGNAELDADYAAAHAGVAPGHYSMIAVSDDGSGMTEETKARLFEPFYTTKRDARGTGLGLASAYGIVRQSGGHIWVYSELGVGTTFKIYLPSVDEPPSGRVRAVVEPADLHGTETVLLVEDDGAVRAAAERTLRQYGYRVLQASNGDEALFIAAEHADSIALVITDVVMPGMSGKELGQRLAAIHPGLRIVYTSGYAEHAALQYGALEAGTPFLSKPYRPQSLLAEVRRQLDLTARASR